MQSDISLEEDVNDLNHKVRKRRLNINKYGDKHKQIEPKWSSLLKAYHTKFSK